MRGSFRSRSSRASPQTSFCGSRRPSIRHPNTSWLRPSWRAAQSKGLKLVVPGDVVETPGEGIEGLVQGHHVVVGGYRFVSERSLG